MMLDLRAKAICPKILIENSILFYFDGTCYFSASIDGHCKYYFYSWHSQEKVRHVTSLFADCPTNLGHFELHSVFCKSIIL